MVEISQRVQRRSERISQQVPLTLLAKFSGIQTEVPASTVDYSEHGLRIRTDFPLNQGQAVYALSTIEGKDLGYFRVVWVQRAEAANPTTEAGLAFVN